MQRLIFVDTINGNLTSDGTSTYTWDVRNRLAAITGPVPASFVYDATGRRARKTINGTVTDFLYDGVNSIQEVSGAGAASLSPASVSMNTLRELTPARRVRS